MEALDTSNQTLIKVEGIGNICHGQSFVMQDIRDHVLSAVSVTCYEKIYVEHTTTGTCMRVQLANGVYYHCMLR